MNDIIQQLTSQLGISSETAISGAGSVLGMLKDKAPAADFGKLAQAVPEVSDWISKASGSNAPASGGGLLGAAAGMLGGGGGVAAVVGMLAKSGLDASTAGKFLPLLLNLLKAKAGATVMNQLASSVPFVKEAMGGGGGGIAGALGSLLGKK